MQKGNAILKILVALVVVVFVAAFAQNHYSKKRQAEFEAQQAALKAKADDETKKLALEDQIKKVELERSQQIANQLHLKEIDSALALNNVYKKWHDAELLSGTTSRIALAPVASSMQGIRRDLELVAVTTCQQPAKVALGTAMDHKIKGILYFMSGKAYESDAIEENEAAMPLYELYQKTLLDCGNNGNA